MELKPVGTFMLVCDDCKVAFRCAHRANLWNPKSVGEFLLEHFGHTLRYLNDDAPNDVRAVTYGAWKHGVH